MRGGLVVCRAAHGGHDTRQTGSRLHILPDAPRKRRMRPVSQAAHVKIPGLDRIWAGPAAESKSKNFTGLSRGTGEGLNEQDLRSPLLVAGINPGHWASSGDHDNVMARGNPHCCRGNCFLARAAAFKWQLGN